MHVHISEKNKTELQKLLSEKKYAFQSLQDDTLRLSEKKFVQHPERLA
ncbi:MAG TPA: hypothetical protein VK037_08980 [Pseudogracilibacillus sp.]|nr:hypothetical protein [Pseudogracilibacillus sp.]